MQLRIIIVATCILLLALGIGYKFHEYQYLKTLVDTYQSVLTDKLTLLEEYNRLQEEEYKNLKTYLDQKPNTPIKEALSNLDKVIKSNKLVLGVTQDYQRKIGEDRKKFQDLQKSEILLLNPVKGFDEKLLTSIDNYYQEEVQTPQNNSIYSDFRINLFETLKDYTIALDFSANLANLTTEKFASAFYKISSLEKYSRDDFSFQNEEEIKKLLPYEYEILTKYREYLKSYYTVSKDVLKGNYDSAQYKSGKLLTDASNLTVDWNRVGRGNEAETTKRGKAILEQLITQLELFRNFKQNGLGKYPFMNEIVFNKKDLLLCHMYSYKKWVYSSVTSEFPEAKTIEDLFKEYSTVSPKTNEFDNEFDKDSMQYTNTDKKIEFICKDKPANKSYTFTTLK